MRHNEFGVHASAWAGSRAAFTLIEVLLALAIAAVVLAAINTVFFGALRLRSATIATTQQTLPLDRAVATIKEDLIGIMPPGTNQGTMIGVMGTDITGVGMTTPPLLEVFTTTGAIQDDVPWGDVQKIDYWLQAPTNNRNSDAVGKDLIRGVTRNLLATIPDAPEQHLVINGVDDLHFSFFDGTNWNSVWSSTLSNVPQAIKVFLTFATPKAGSPLRPPIQFVVPVVMQISTNTN